jgi:hypothetical protein
MGLDSVELLMAFEDYFGIRIPDDEAANILTVQNMVDSVAKHLNIESIDSPLKEKISDKLNVALAEVGLINSNLLDETPIFKVLDPENTTIWTSLSNQLGLLLPIPNKKANGKTKRFFKIRRSPGYNWEEITISQFINAISAINYEKLIDQNNIKDQFEILVGIIAITVDKIGVDFYEVKPNVAFTYDLGVN